MLETTILNIDFFVMSCMILSISADSLEWIYERTTADSINFIIG